MIAVVKVYFIIAQHRYPKQDCLPRSIVEILEFMVYSRKQMDSLELQRGEDRQ